MDPGSKVLILIGGGVTAFMAVWWVARRLFHIRDDPTSRRDHDDPGGMPPGSEIPPGHHDP